MLEQRVLSPEDLELEVPEFSFRPNAWTEAFLLGLREVSVEDKRVLEIGVGTGIVAIDLLRRGIREYVGLDIDERVLPVARENMVRKVPEALSKTSLLHSDLLESLPEGQKFDLICGCLPQVCKTPLIEFGVADSYARYFDAEKHQSALNVYGLGLNENALAQAKTRLEKDGRVVLVLSGRAGQARLEQLFIDQGYQPRILFETIILQLWKTSLASLAEAEKAGHEFFFYKDPFCQERISVCEAELRRMRGFNSYHKLYVFEGRLAN